MKTRSCPWPRSRASRLRGEGGGRGGAIADLEAEVAAARRRAEEEAEDRQARAEERQLERTAEALAAAARHARRLRAGKRRAAPALSEAELAGKRQELAEFLARVTKGRQ